jgi:hypothetical protein
MSAAFNARQDNMPRPGVKGPPLKIALSNSENIPAKSIELVSNSCGIAELYYGSISEASQNAIRHLDSVSTIELESTNSAIISTGSEIGMHSTLSDSLNSLWNSIHIVRENGSAILLSENRDLLYLQELRQKGLCLGIVSTLPQYYLNKLGFKTYIGLKNVLEKLLTRYGKNHKVLVLSDANIEFLKKKTL